MAEPLWRRWQDMRSDTKLIPCRRETTIDNTNWRIDFYPRSGRLYARTSDECYLREESTKEHFNETFNGVKDTGFVRC